MYCLLQCLLLREILREKVEEIFVFDEYSSIQSKKRINYSLLLFELPIIDEIPSSRSRK